MAEARTPEAEGSPPALRTAGLRRVFGGLAAVAGVSIECHTGRLHAVIGPNGAGKTTLINLLSGDLAPSAGRIEILGRDVTGLPAHRIARLGVGRSYQRSNIFMSFSVFENCRIAAQARLGSSMRFARPAARYEEINEAARAALRLAELDAREDLVAAELSHGERRQLEVAMTLATAPRLLLLDEPLAGMGAEESARMVGVLKKLVPGHAMLLVEHDMDAVFALADILTVMVDGQVLASGAPEQMRANREVQQAYLGAESHG
ncbi:MAG: ABC transporter ATP-binding protein [Betaproteobacteria bacterium]|nr:ABC transporter ATP-binding protein [Betaproteobacteria bacterium]